MEKEHKIETVYSLPLEQKVEVGNKIKDLENLLQSTLNDLEGVRKHTEKIVALMTVEETEEVRDSQMGVIIELGKLRQTFEQAIGKYSSMITECKELQGSLQETHERWSKILQSFPNDSSQ